MLFDVGVLVDLEADDVDHLEVVVRTARPKNEPSWTRRSPNDDPVWYRPELGPRHRYRFDVHLGPGWQGSGGSWDPTSATRDRVTGSIQGSVPRVEVRA